MTRVKAKAEAAEMMKTQRRESLSWMLILMLNEGLRFEDRWQSESKFQSKRTI